MLQKNVYKPRYKLAFQAKSKIWPYKNSRLRRFFNIRGRKILRRGFFKRIVMVFNNMKWTIARRYIRPEMRRRKARKRRYRDAFYNKQKLRLFYGKIKETRFRTFYQKYLINSVNRNRSFFAALERRLDIFFFRSRLLPTIFACNQYIHHYGLSVNKKLEYSSHILLNPGDTISISKTHWAGLFWSLHYRIFNRAYGKEVSIKRKYHLLKKKTRWLRKKIINLTWLFFLRQKFYQIYELLLKSQKYFLFYFDSLFYKVYNFYKRPLTTLNNIERKIRLNFENLIKRLEELFIKYQIIFNNYLKYISSINKLYKNIQLAFYSKFFKKKKFLWRSKTQKRKHRVFLFLLRLKYKYIPANFLKFKWQVKNNFLNKNIRLSDLLQKLKTEGFKDKKSHLPLEIKKKIKNFAFNLSANKIYLYNKIPMLTLNLYKEIYMLFVYLKLEELQYYNILLSSFKGQDSSDLSWIPFLESYIDKEIDLVIVKSIMLRKKFNKYFALYLRKIFIKQKLRTHIRYNRKLKKFLPKPNTLIYFLLNKKYKKKRRLKIFRLKFVHWSIPKYVQFDFRTLRAIFLYSPTPNEIHYSFKCSLTKITAFYKSLAL